MKQLSQICFINNILVVLLMSDCQVRKFGDSLQSHFFFFIGQPSLYTCIRVHVLRMYEVTEILWHGGNTSHPRSAVQTLDPMWESWYTGGQFRGVIGITPDKPWYMQNFTMV